MKKEGAFWGFQSYAGYKLTSSRDKMPSFFKEEHIVKALKASAGLKQVNEWMREHGLLIHSGSDLFGTDELWGLMPRNITVLSELGYSNAEALMTATGNAGKVLMMSGPMNPYKDGTLGVIEKGAYADILLWNGNPLENLELILDDEKLQVIMKDGVIYKNTLPAASPDEDEATIRARLTIDGRIAIYGVQFKTDSAELIEGSDRTIGVIASVLKANPGVKIAVVGHTDARGSHEHNLELSKLRADAVVAALINSHGIAGDRLFAAGASFLSPIAANDNEEGRALNRRVELVRVQ